LQRSCRAAPRAGGSSKIPSGVAAEHIAVKNVVLMCIVSTSILLLRLQLPLLLLLLLLLLHCYTRFKHVTSFTKVKNLKCEKSQCHRRNARLYRAVLSLDLKVAIL